MTANRTGPAESPGVLPLVGWLACTAFFFYAWVLRVAPSVMVEELMRDFAVGAALLGNLSAAYFYGYAGMQIPVGLLLDRFGPRRLLAAAAVSCGCGCVLFATGETLTAVLFGRLLIGASAAFSLVGAMAVAGQWFPPARFAVLSGMSMAIGLGGGIFGQAPLRLSIEATDWRTTTLMLAVAGLVIGVALFATVRDRRRGSGGVSHVLASLATVMRHRQTWLIAAVGLGSAAPVLGFAGLWGVPFLQTAYGLPPAEAATLTSLMFVGCGVGAPLLGWLSDRARRRHTPLMLGMALEAASLAVLVLAPGLPLILVAALSFLVGFFAGTQVICFALVRENHPTRLSGTAIGFVNGMMTGAGALFQPLIGLCLDLTWKGELLAGARVYDAAGYRWALATLVAVGVAAFLCSLPIRETFCRGYPD